MASFTSSPFNWPSRAEPSRTEPNRAQGSGPVQPSPVQSLVLVLVLLLLPVNRMLYSAVAPWFALSLLAVPLPYLSCSSRLVSSRVVWCRFPVADCTVLFVFVFLVERFVTRSQSCTIGRVSCRYSTVTAPVSRSSRVESVWPIPGLGILVF